MDGVWVQKHDRQLHSGAVAQRHQWNGQGAHGEGGVRAAAAGGGGGYVGAAAADYVAGGRGRGAVGGTLEPAACVELPCRVACSHNGAIMSRPRTLERAPQNVCME